MFTRCATPLCTRSAGRSVRRPLVPVTAVVICLVQGFCRIAVNVPARCRRDFSSPSPAPPWCGGASLACRCTQMFLLPDLVAWGSFWSGGGRCGGLHGVCCCLLVERRLDFSWRSMVCSGEPTEDCRSTFAPPLCLFAGFFFSVVVAGRKDAQAFLGAVAIERTPI